MAAGQNTAALAATAVTLNGATITDGAGNAANLSLSGLTQTGPQIDTTTPTISSITESPSSGDVSTGSSVTLTLAMSENVTVNTTGGTPTLALNDLGTASYVSSSGNMLTFSYTVAAGQNTAALAATAVNLNGATITDGAGNAANLSLSGLTQTGPQIGTTVPPPPVITSDTRLWGNKAQIHGTAEAGATVTVYDGTTRLGTTTANASGAWTYTTSPLQSGSHVFTATETVAGQTSVPSNAVDPVIGGTVGTNPTIITQKLGNAPADIGNNTVLEINTPDSGKVTFTGTNGALWLDQPSTFTGRVSGFGAQNAIDLPGIAFDGQTTLGYSPNANNAGGTLSVTNGTQSAQIALLGNYIASSFAVVGDSHGGTSVVTSASQNGNQSLLVIPQHHS